MLMLGFAIFAFGKKTTGFGREGHDIPFSAHIQGFCIPS